VKQAASKTAIAEPEQLFTQVFFIDFAGNFYKL